YISPHRNQWCHKPNFEYKFCVGGRIHDFVSSRVFHRRIKLVIGTERPAVKDRFLIPAFVSASVGDKHLLRCDDLRGNRRRRHQFGMVCSESRDLQQKNQKTDTYNRSQERSHSLSSQTQATARNLAPSVMTITCRKQMG